MLKNFIKPVLIAILIVLGLIGFGTVINFFFSTSDSLKTPHGIVVQDSTKVSQGQNEQNENISNLKFSFPSKIFGSDYSIRAVTFQELQTSDIYKRAGVIEPGVVVNLVFFNTKTQDYRLLFNKPVYIRKYVYPIDSSDLGKSKILYEVNIIDSNKDGVINAKDNSILFSSNLDGKGLIQITPDSVSVVQFQFEEKNQSLIIDTQYPPKEYEVNEYLWPHQQFWYDFSSNRFKYFQFDMLLQQAKKVIGK